jgi:hypothetical protein
MPTVTKSHGSRKSQVIDTAIATISLGHMPKKSRRTQYTQLLEEFAAMPMPKDAQTLEGRVDLKIARKPQSVVLGLRRTIGRNPELENIKVVQAGEEVWLVK